MRGLAVGGLAGGASYGSLEQRIRVRVSSLGEVNSNFKFQKIEI